ncbi:hypothetical protein ACFPIJ_09690 [Dactylosporangium cerinum]|uniref:Transcriptional regulator n=1 Tax=Dactylosporangium cerinum TaxID=1434730 RepID=A0ABV9VQ34_9ACTN
MTATLLDREVSYRELIDAGALQLYPERDLRRWFGGGSRRTVGDLLAVPTHPSRVVWAVMRERVLPAHVLYQIAVDYAGQFVDHARRRGVYLDFRTVRGLVAMQDWLDDRISLGARLIAAEAAGQARTDVADLGEPPASAAADIVCAAMLDNAEAAFRETFYLYLDGHGDAAGLRWVVARARARLGAVACDRTAR